jgi:hypothetical protein
MDRFLRPAIARGGAVGEGLLHVGLDVVVRHPIADDDAAEEDQGVYG